MKRENIMMNRDAAPVYNGSLSGVMKMITSAQRTIIKFAGQSMEAQANMSNERIMGLLH